MTRLAYASCDVGKTAVRAFVHATRAVEKRVDSRRARALDAWVALTSGALGATRPRALLASFVASVAHAIVIRIVAVTAREYACAVLQVGVHAKRIALKAVRRSRPIACSTARRMAIVAHARWIGCMIARTSCKAAALEQERQQAGARSTCAVVAMARIAVGGAVLQAALALAALHARGWS